MDELMKLAKVEIDEVNPEKRMDLKVGVSYKSSFKIAENGVIKVRPYRQGGKPSNLHKIEDGDNYAIFGTKKVLRVVVSLQKGNREDMKHAFAETMMEVYKSLATLEV